jgi:hypothetical protein
MRSSQDKHGEAACLGAFALAVWPKDLWECN